MNKKDDGGPAFPTDIRRAQQYATGGMTLRDYFAGQIAMSGAEAAIVGARAEGMSTDDAAKIVARMAYHMADAMIEERERK
jgi:hypothetical protein